MMVNTCNLSLVKQRDEENQVCVGATTKPCLKQNKASNPKVQNSKEFTAYKSPNKKVNYPQAIPRWRSCHATLPTMSSSSYTPPLKYQNPLVC